MNTYLQLKKKAFHTIRVYGYWYTYLELRVMQNWKKVKYVYLNFANVLSFDTTILGNLKPPHPYDVLLLFMVELDKF